MMQASADHLDGLRMSGSTGTVARPELSEERFRVNRGRAFGQNAYPEAAVRTPATACFQRFGPPDTT